MDAVADLKPGRLGELGVRRDADPHHDGVGRDVAAVGKAHAADAVASAGDLVDAGAHAQVDAVGAVQVGEDLGHLAAEHPQQRQLGHLHDGDLGAGGAGRGGRLEPDPAGADHRHAFRALERLPDPVAVAHRAQVVHARRGRPPAPAGGAATSRWRAAACRTRPGCRRRA